MSKNKNRQAVPNMAQPSTRDLMVAEANISSPGNPLRIGDFFWTDRSQSADYVSSGYATRATEAQKDWLAKQQTPMRGRYNRRDMNAREP